MANFHSVRVADSVAVLGDVSGGLHFHFQSSNTMMASTIMRSLTKGEISQPSSCYVEKNAIEELCQRFVQLQVSPAMRDPDCYGNAHRFIANINTYTACSRAGEWNLKVDVPLGNVMRRFQVYYNGERIAPVGQELSHCREFLIRDTVCLGPPSINLLTDLFIFLLPDFFPHPEHVRRLIYRFLVNKSSTQMGAYHPLTLILKQLQFSFTSSDEFMRFVPLNALLDILLESIPAAPADSNTLIVRDNIYVLVGSLLECYGRHQERLDLLQSNVDAAIRDHGEKSYTTNLARLNLAYALRIQGYTAPAKELATEVRFTWDQSKENERLRACATELLGRLACDDGKFDDALYYWEDSIKWYMNLDKTWRSPRLARQYRDLSVSFGKESRLEELRSLFPDLFAELGKVDNEL